ncbi:VOC family protein [Algoriphagus formosus]|uniref:VOC family protein n=1 Tax=Algoriphagus formosus TaxID=2007308 RepID=A0A4R5URF8_9BACT|nr:VOC family protein [Algoriphagus aquimaris]TDK41516.1 VOC family protein [Algoriphagus aquimaris]
MQLGAFSISLSVKNLQASKEFYEKLGFEVFAGGDEQNYLIMKNDQILIGLFHEMFEKNILTFNPSWNQEAQEISDYDDVRKIQKSLKESGIPLAQEADPNGSGPASILLFDPDGNSILIDQHV